MAHCSFPREHLDDTLRDRFVCGLRSESIQKRLLSGKDLTIANALEKAQNMEAAHRNAQALKGLSPTLPVGKLMERGLPSKSSRRTHRSGSEGHGGNVACHRCGADDHKGGKTASSAMRNASGVERRATWPRCAGATA